MPDLKKPEVTVDSWTLDELKDGREFVFHDRENPHLGYRARVFVRDGSMFAEISNAAGAGSTGQRREVKRPAEPMPPRPLEPAQPEDVCRLIWRQELERDIDAVALAECVRALQSGKQPAAIRAALRETPEFRELEEQRRRRPKPDMHQWPKFGCSYQTGMTHPDVVPREWATLLADAGCNLTRIWCYDAWAIGPNGPGQYAGFVPWERDGAGVFDLDRPNNAYDDRLHTFVSAMNASGITVQLTVLELYGWSARKRGLMWVPDANLGPFRRNKNGVRWGEPDDPTFETLPDAVLDRFIERVCTATRGLAVAFEIGNEMPEKPMHERIAERLRSHFTADWRPDVTVNRQEDTPGQYDNMAIGRKYERIAYHGKDSLAYLDEEFPQEPRWRSFRAFFDGGQFEAGRIIMSTDGCRANATVRPYNFDELRDVCRDHLRRGFSVEHQSQVKMRPFVENRLDLRGDFEGDWLRTLRV